MTSLTPVQSLYSQTSAPSSFYRTNPTSSRSALSPIQGVNLDKAVQQERKKVALPVIITIIILLLIIIIVLILWWVGIIGKQQKPPPINVNALIEEGLEKSGWSQNVLPSDDPIRSQCNVYTFPPQTSDIPAQISFNTEVVDTLTPVSVSQFQCIAANQLALQQVVRTCTGDGLVAGICRDDNGNVFTTGQTQTLYQSCSANQCPGQLGLVGLNFQAIPNFANTSCLTSILGNPAIPVTGSNCSLENINQYYQVIRYKTSGSGTGLVLSPDPSGQIAALQDLSSGLCLGPTTNNPISGQNVLLQPCTALLNNGAVWFLAPPFIFDSTQIPNQVAPQQIIYTTDPSNLPTATQMQQFIQTQNPLSLAATEQQGGFVSLVPTQTVSPTINPNNQAQLTNAQILNYQIFGILQGNQVPFVQWS